MSGPRKVSDMFTFIKNTKRSCGQTSDHRRAGVAGFTLIEMLVSLVVLSVIMGGVVTAISTAEQTYARTAPKTDMYENVRGVAELMTQEIGQAGLVSLPPTTLGAATTIGATTATLSSTTSLYVGERVQIDAGASEESVVTSAVTSTTITFTTTPLTLVHASGAPVTALGSFPSGVVPTAATDGSSGTTLNLFGDINGDGTLVYVRYVCNVGTTAAPGTLTRSVTAIAPGVNTIAASQTLLNTVIGPAGGCFNNQYVQQTEPNTGLTFVTTVGFTVSVQATVPDPQTGQYATMTKSFLNLSPRNVVAGYEQAAANVTVRLQATPPNVSLY
jgi:prepilin-type N-terminal cleavage/methylation domain-containing protein